MGRRALLQLCDERHGTAARAIPTDHEQHADAELHQAVGHLFRVLVAARGTEHGATLVVNFSDGLGRQRERLMP